jgi:putative membrane protein
MKKNLGLIGITAVAFIACTTMVTSRSFIHKASEASEFEIQTSMAALERSNNGDVLQLAKQIIDDHKKISLDLKNAIDAADIQEQPTTILNAEHQEDLRRLKTLSRDMFDREYLKIQRQAHEDAIVLFDNYIRYAQNESPVRDFARSHLHILKDHLNHINSFQLD